MVSGEIHLILDAVFFFCHVV